MKLSFKLWLENDLPFDIPDSPDWRPTPEETTTYLKHSHPELQEFFIRYSPAGNPIANIVMPASASVGEKNQFRLTGKQIKEILKKFIADSGKNKNQNLNHMDARKDLIKFFPFIDYFIFDKSLDEKNFIVQTEKH